MKIQKWHLFAFVVVLFAFSFYVINLKFDRFYRVNGVNNDNRVLIEKYLTKSEQSYLIDNQIQIDLFIDYIEYESFVLENYQYYNLLEQTQRYGKKENILATGNELASRLEYMFDSKAFSNAKKLVESSLETAFLNEPSFNFEYLTLYSYMNQLYSINDFSYINDTHQYVAKLNNMGITNSDEQILVIEKLTQAYNKESLDYIMNADLPSNVNVVLNPHDLSTIVNKQNYIGIYEPTELLLIQDVPRVRYSMYLQSEAYNALVDMYQDISNNFDGFLLRKSYIGHESLSNNQIGYEEFQLGLSINVSKQEIAYNQFETTDISQWLEEHAYEYGYILRYPKNKASITGYGYNSHIYRYVGKELAKTLHDSLLTLEEYKLTQE